MNALKHVSHSASPQPVFEPCAYTSFLSLLPEALWFGIFFNIAYLYVYYNRNNHNKKALAFKVWLSKFMELGILVIKFGGFYIVTVALGMDLTLIINPLVVLNQIQSPVVPSSPLPMPDVNPNQIIQSSIPRNRNVNAVGAATTNTGTLANVPQQPQEIITGKPPTNPISTDPTA